MMENIQEFDPELFKHYANEKKRQEENIELIASENIVSKNVLSMLGTIYTNKYAEGYPSKRYYGGCEFVDKVEDLAIERLKKLFKVNYANVQPHSGSQANFAVYLAELNPGDKVLGMNLAEGGHLTHGSPVNFSGKLFHMIHYGLDTQGYIDYDEVQKIADREKPKMIIAGASAYSRKIDFKRFREIADRVGAVLMADIAHIAGLVATRLHQSPVEYAHYITSTTHKTLRGPRGGIILTNDEAKAKKMNSAIFPGSQGGPLLNVIAAKAVCFKEALDPSFVEYQKKVIENAKYLGDKLIEKGFSLVSQGTDNHLLLVDLTLKKVTGKQMQNTLDSIHITLNKNSIPNDPASFHVTSGIRIGTPAVTTRNMGLSEMDKIANWIDVTSKNIDNPSSLDPIREEVLNMTAQFPMD